MTTVLFNPNPPYLRCCVFRNGKQDIHNVYLQENWKEVLIGELGIKTGPEVTGYVLHNGGRDIRKPVSLLSPQQLKKIRRCVPLLPEYNAMTLDIADFWQQAWPGKKHFLLCDSAFLPVCPHPPATTPSLTS